MLSFGFYNSLDGDRKYDALQVSRIFDGIIEDGVYSNIGEFLATVPGTGMGVIVKTGRAWFNHTWSLNDSYIPLTLSDSDFLQTRIDAVVLEVDARTEYRENSIKIVEGTASVNPVKPTLTNEGDGGLNQHALAYVTVSPNVSEITSGDIEIVVGTDETPFVQCPLKTVSITDLFQQWDEEFTEWFNNIKLQLTDNVVTNLQRQIDEKVNIADKATDEDIANEDPGKWVSAASLIQVGTSGGFNKVGDIVICANRNLEEETNGKWVACDQRVWKKGEIPDEIFEKYRYRVDDSISSLKQTGPVTFNYVQYTNSNNITTSTYSLMMKPKISTGFPSANYPPYGGVDYAGASNRNSALLLPDYVLGGLTCNSQNVSYANFKNPDSIIAYTSLYYTSTSSGNSTTYGIPAVMFSAGDYVISVTAVHILKFDDDGNLVNVHNLSVTDVVSVSYIKAADRYILLTKSKAGSSSIYFSDNEFKTVTVVTTAVTSLTTSWGIGNIIQPTYSNTSYFSPLQEKNGVLYYAFYTTANAIILHSEDYGESWTPVTLVDYSSNNANKILLWYINDDNEFCCFGSSITNSSYKLDSTVPVIYLNKWNPITGEYITSKELYIVNADGDIYGTCYPTTVPTITLSSDTMLTSLSNTEFAMSVSLKGLPGTSNLIYNIEKEAFYFSTDIGIGVSFTTRNDRGIMISSTMDSTYPSQYYTEKHTTPYTDSYMSAISILDCTNKKVLRGFHDKSQDAISNLSSYNHRPCMTKNGFWVGNYNANGDSLVFYSFDRIRAPYIENGYIKLED